MGWWVYPLLYGNNGSWSTRSHKCCCCVAEWNPAWFEGSRVLNHPKIGVGCFLTPQIYPFVHRVWNHYFHHPFWVFSLYFWKHPNIAIAGKSPNFSPGKSHRLNPGPPVSASELLVYRFVYATNLRLGKGKTPKHPTHWGWCYFTYICHL